MKRYCDFTVNCKLPDRSWYIFASRSWKDRFSGAILHCSKQLQATVRHPKTFHMMQHLSPAPTACVLTGVRRGGEEAFLWCCGLFAWRGKVRGRETPLSQSVKKDVCVWLFKRMGKMCYMHAAHVQIWSDVLIEPTQLLPTLAELGGSWALPRFSRGAEGEALKHWVTASAN